MKLPRINAEIQRDSSFNTSVLDADQNILVIGGYTGEYAMCRLDDSIHAKHVEGRVTDLSGIITNHVFLHQSRTNGTPLAIFSSNDDSVRWMDCETQKFIQKANYQYPINCIAASPDSRLHVNVGDNSEVLITNAETGEILQKLPGHHDYGFACAWSEDGYTVATGNQDRQVNIYDARNWKSPLTILAATQAGVRSLRFSPLGSGRRVLVAAEPSDYVHIIDAVTCASEQTVDFFGEIAGTTFTPDGSELFIANADPHVGGLMQLERWGNRSGRGMVPKDRFAATHQYDDEPVSLGLNWEGRVRRERERGWQWDWEWDWDGKGDTKERDYWRPGRRFKTNSIWSA
jgi:WD40 repeat protein